MQVVTVLSSTIQKRLTQLAVIFLFTILYLLFTTSLVHAQTPDCQPSSDGTNYGQVVKDVNRCARSENLSRDQIFNWNQITATADSINTLITGRSYTHPETNAITAESGALSGLAKAIALTYAVPPVSGVDYIAHQIHNFNPLKPAYAQQTGIGFDLLTPVQKIWTAFRNASYVGFVIVFVVIGFMVMFRAHISPQAVATVQDSLPRIVIALILVTFSYAIAGLMIDIMFLLLNIAINLLIPADLSPEGAKVVFEKSVFGIFLDSWTDIFGAVSSGVQRVLEAVIQVGVLNKIIGFLGGSVIGIIAGIAMLFIMVRVFLMLLTSYVTIILLTMFAPFFFLFQALPGRSGAKEWFRQMAASVSVFPSVALMIIFAGMLGGLKGLGGSSTPQFTSEKIGHFPLLSGLIQADDVGKLIALGFLLMTPEVAKQIKEKIGIRGGPGIAAGFAAVGAAGGFAGRRVAGSPFGQAAIGLKQYGSERMTESLINKAPGFLRGGEKLQRGMPTWRKKTE